MPELTFPDNKITANMSTDDEAATFSVIQPEDASLNEEFLDFDEELIIEDFTVDGICGVY